MTLILASQSPRRKEILRSHGYQITIIPAKGVQEQHHFARPSTTVMHNARQKAHAVARMRKSGIVIGADTVIYFKGAIIGKPRTTKEACAVLRALQHARHAVYTGVCIYDAARQKQTLFYEKTIVVFKALSDDTIKRYISLIDPLDKAGAYAIQEYGDMIIKNIVGSHTNVIGFPIETFNKKIRPYFGKRSKP